MPQLVQTPLPTGHVTLLDGGIGTEVRRRGVTLHPGCWSAMAHVQAPDLVRQIHLDYIDAGADVISANTFMAGRHILEHAGLSGGVRAFETINRSAVETARSAASRSEQRQVRVAGSLGLLPPQDAHFDIPRGREIEHNFAHQAEILAEAGVDLLLPEMLIDVEMTAALLNACCATGLPVWAGLSASRDVLGGETLAFRPPGKLLGMPRETLRQVIDVVLDFEVEAVGIMHTKARVMPDALSALRSIYPGAMMAYPETGTASDDDWSFDTADGPVSMTTHLINWHQQWDLRVLGGCCGTTPAHIRHLAKTLGRQVDHTEFSTKA